MARRIVAPDSTENPVESTPITTPEPAPLFARVRTPTEVVEFAKQRGLKAEVAAKLNAVFDGQFASLDAYDPTKSISVIDFSKHRLHQGKTVRGARAYRNPNVQVTIDPEIQSPSWFLIGVEKLAGVQLDVPGAADGSRNLRSWLLVTPDTLSDDVPLQINLDFQDSELQNGGKILTSDVSFRAHSRRINGLNQPAVNDLVGLQGQKLLAQAAVTAILETVGKGELPAPAPAFKPNTRFQNRGRYADAPDNNTTVAGPTAPPPAGQQVSAVTSPEMVAMLNRQGATA